MMCNNPGCRQRNKRKLRPLVISLIKDDENAVGNGGGNSRHELITRMFTTDPSLASHFEPPIFSSGVPSRDLRNRMKLLEHCNSAGLIPAVEWEAIMKAVNEHNMDNHQEDTSTSHQDSKAPTNNNFNCEISEKPHRVLNPFKYLAIETLIPPSDDTKSTTNKKTKHWLEYQTTSLIPISPERQGSTEDRALPYSMEIWRKAKTLNRDRSVLACSLAHLLAMKTLVGGDHHGNDTSVDSNDDVGFDFILEDNVRAFTGMNMTGKHPEESTTATASDWSCECANRIWDTIEASNEASHDCHMRYYGWLASLPNMRWVYQNHIPRSAFNGAKQRYDGYNKCMVFPRPTTDDFKQDSNTQTIEEDLNETGPINCQGPQFTTPGGTAIWGTFAYTVSPTAYRTIINRLNNDVGLLMWKGKRMRAYKAKPIDKIIPRLIKEQFGATSVHVPSKVAFVRCPMLGSLLHPQWEAGFCNSTELQYQLSCGGNESIHSSTSVNGYDVWNDVWLAEEERQIVHHRIKSGHWVHKGYVPDDLCDICERESTSSRSPFKSAKSLSAIFLAAIIVISSTPSMSAFNSSVNLRFKRSKFVMNSSHDLDDCANIYTERRQGKIGRMSIISRTIYLDTEVDSIMQHKGEDFVRQEIKRLNVTVWEMDKPSELIQEWWSIDESERCSRVGDPFGVVMWPGSILVSKELLKLHYSNQLKSPIVGATVLVLGAGTGVEAQTAALLGAKRVIATDINPLTLKLLEYGAKNAGISGILEGKYFDLFSDISLPECDILIVADVLYNQDLAKQVGQRIHEAITRSFDEGAPPTKIIVTDSQQFHGTNFLEDAKLRELNAIFREGNFEQLRWESHKIERVCTSGVLIGKSILFFLFSRLSLLCSLLVPYLTDEDQTYDVDIRMITWGW